MPQQYIYRQWCKTCCNFEFHREVADDKFICSTCKTEFTNYFLADVPEDKQLEQRERYKKSESNKMGNRFAAYGSMLGGLGSSNPLEEMGFFDKDGGWARNTTIIEADAGQEAIDEATKQRRLSRQAQINAELQRINENRKLCKDTGRNDPCPLCLKEGATIKLKKCKNHYHP